MNNSVYIHGINWRVIAPWMIVFILALVVVVGTATALVLSQAVSNVVCQVPNSNPTQR